MIQLHDSLNIPLSEDDKHIAIIRPVAAIRNLYPKMIESSNTVEGKLKSFWLDTTPAVEVWNLINQKLSLFPIISFEII